MNEGHDQSSGSHAAASGVDVLSDVLRSVRLTASMLFLVDATTPWMSWAPPTEAFRRLVLPGCQHMVSYHVVTDGHCWAGLCGGPPEPFVAGDVLVVPHGDAYYLADRPHAEASYCPEEAVQFFRAMSAGEMRPVVREGGCGTETTQFICGFLGCDLRPFNPVLSALPAMLHLRAATGESDPMRHLIEFALSVLREWRSGQHDVLLRLAELMFVEVVRRHLDTMSEAKTGWLAGLHDPLVSRALALLHGAPERRWSLDALAVQVNTSRSVLAERFTHFVGQPPMHYLTQWRMQMAVRMLAQQNAKILVIAHKVGYESEAAFSRAFKKSVGVAPAAWRQRLAT